MSEPTANDIPTPADTVPDNGAPPPPEDVANKVTQAFESDFFGQMERLLDQLVPPDEVVINTCDGTTHTLPGAIPARRQIKVFRHLRELVEVPSVTASLGSVSANQGAGAIVGVIISLATDEKVAELIGQIFQEAYPEACGEEDPLDLYPIEELVVALVPFLERFVKRVGSGVITLGKSANNLSN